MLGRGLGDGRAAPQRRRRRGRPRLRIARRPERRKAFLATLRAVVGTEGQRVAALDRLYLAEELPLLIVWGDRDPIIPVAHGEEAHASCPTAASRSSRASATCPSSRRRGRFIAALQRFLDETEPARFDREEWVARFKSA